MIFKSDDVCPVCGGQLKLYDHVKRILRTKNRMSVYIRIPRVRCVQCKKIHRVLPDELMPFKQYEADMIQGVKDGLITSDTFGYEDYPCEMTMKRWLTE